MKPDMNDKIICVLEMQEYDENSEVWFVNFTALQHDNSVGARQYAAFIAKALGTKTKTCEADVDYSLLGGNEDAEKYAVLPPCMVHDHVVLYFS